MPIIDADSHFIEPFDWFERCRPDLAAQLPQPGFAERRILGLEAEVLVTAPPEATPDALAMLHPGLLQLRAALGDVPDPTLAEALRRSDLDFGKFYAAVGSWDPTERLPILDAHGIELQFINPSHGTMPFVRASMEGRHDLAREALRAYHDWAIENLYGLTDRLVPVAQAVLSDLEFTLAEVRRMREAGSRMVSITAGPIGGKSLAHPDFEPFWSLAEDLGMIVLFHAGAGRPAVDRAWGNMGGDPEYGAWVSAITTRLQEPSVPENALSGLILGGVLERHPRLVFQVAEYGIGWLPGWLERADLWTGPGHVIVFDNKYRLPLKPSEYAQRQLRVTALPWDPLQPTIGIVPDGMVVFSSDYPHPEGTQDAIGVFAPQLAGLDPTVSEQFFGGSLASVLAA